MVKEKVKYMDFKPYPKYKNCFINNDASDWIKRKKDPIVCHYMPYSRLEEWIKKSIMTFVSPNQWDDPFEKIYLHTALTNLPLQKDYEPPNIACLCFTKSSFRNSVAFWNAFKKSETTQLVRVLFDFKQMISLLMESLKRHKINAHVYIAAIDYSLKYEDIKNKQVFIKYLIRNISAKIEAESLYVKMLSYKRSAFAFENEIRVIIIPQKEQLTFNENECFEVKDLDYKAFTNKIWLEPIRLPSGWVSKDMAREVLKDYEDKIGQSVLYKEQKKCERINLEIDWRD